MRTGTIIYLADAKTMTQEVDTGAAAQALGLRPEWTELAASAPGYYQVSEALLELARRGAGRVDLMAARRSDERGLSPSSARVRVLG
jgi:phosphoribosylformylglycinamidine (FGAM) synthase-like enzyme